MRADGFDVQRRIERPKALFVKFDAGFEKAFAWAGYDHTNVDELFPLDFGNHTDDGVVISIEIGHEWPPPGTHAAASASSLDTRCKRSAVAGFRPTGRR